MRFSCKAGDKTVGFYEINSFPGCAQLAVSNHAFINPAVRNQGYGKVFHAERLLKVKELGYDYLLCTVKADNVFQKKILDRFGWKRLDSFVNQETGSVVELYGKGIVKGIVK